MSGAIALAQTGLWRTRLASLFGSSSQGSFQLPALLGPILWAAPKKKTSHSKKRMRASNKGLQQKENVVACPACGSPKLLHHLCKRCYSDIKEKTLEESLTKAVYIN